MKRLLITVLAAVLVFQAGMTTVYAGSAEDEKHTMIISDIDTSALYGTAPGYTTTIEVDGCISRNIRILYEKWVGPDGRVISGNNIAVAGGIYSYMLCLRADGTLTFNNDLEVFYQGVNGRYRLEYEIDENNDHIMVVTGLFDNIIVASPLLRIAPSFGRNYILSNVSEDQYFYRLALKTDLGFSFTNRLQFLYKTGSWGYSINYLYDLPANSSKFRINIPPVSDISFFGGTDMEWLAAEDQEAAGETAQEIAEAVADEAGNDTDEANAHSHCQYIPDYSRYIREIVAETSEMISKITGITETDLPEPAAEDADEAEVVTDNISTDDHCHFVPDYSRYIRGIVSETSEVITRIKGNNDEDPAAPVADTADETEEPSEEQPDTSKKHFYVPDFSFIRNRLSYLWHLIGKIRNGSSDD